MILPMMIARGLMAAAHASYMGLRSIKFTYEAGE